jgi:pimeloyl-ACP methyl ester carboxylesterase
LIFAGSWLHLRYWVRRLTVAVEYASVDRIPTPDGSAIELRRVPRPDAAAEHAGVGLPPVLLVHGIAANHRNFDAHPDVSLARHLARAGRDVWLLTLRSGRVDRRSAEDRLVRFSAMVDHDVPIAVRAVLEKTGAPQLDYIGFSMGGMLLYASIGKTIEERMVRRAAVVGSPGRVRSPIPFTGWFAGFVPRLFVPGMWFRLVARFWAFASEWVPATPLQRIVYNPRNVAVGGTRGALVNVIVDVPASLNHDFVRWVARGGKVTHHGDDVLERVRGVRVPCLFIAGAGDRIAPPAAVHAAFDAWSKDHPETPKTFVVLGRETGATHDYGHGDLAIGMAVQQDVFDPLERFLRAEPLGGAVPA